MSAPRPGAWPPSELLVRARALEAGTLAVAEPRHAATVVLIRDAADRRPDGRLEVFLLRRVTTMAFAAGMHVFPGGKVDPSDDLEPGATLPPDWADELTGGDMGLLRKVVAAAVRETAEEAGVVLAPNDLRPFAHWVTPEVEPRRYDTRFLIAALPVNQQARLADEEADRGVWVSPAEGCALPMMPPTRAALEDLSGCADVASALAKVRNVHRILPRFILDGDTLRLSLGDELTGRPGGVA